MDNKCKYYNEYRLHNIKTLETEIQCFCYGTKNVKPCTCFGDESKCDFYPEKRMNAIPEELPPESPYNHEIDQIIEGIKALHVTYEDHNSIESIINKLNKLKKEIT